MSQPEISRRCRSCGAAVRAGARFCPQCGQQMEAAPAADVEAARETESPREWAPPTKEFSAFVESVGGGAAADSRDARQVTGEAPFAFETTPATTREEAPMPAAGGEASAASSAAGFGPASANDEARGRVARVREGTRARVERMREEALVVLEEAPDDSGLRFVVAAAALFLLFLLILLLSTTVLR